MSRRLVERSSEDRSATVIVYLGEVIEAHREREEFAERVPAKVILFIKLLHVLRR